MAAITLFTLNIGTGPNKQCRVFTDCHLSSIFRHNNRLVQKVRTNIEINQYVVQFSDLYDSFKDYNSASQYVDGTKDHVRTVRAQVCSNSSLPLTES